MERIIDIPMRESTRIRLNKYGYPGEHMDTVINNLMDYVDNAKDGLNVFYLR